MSTQPQQPQPQHTDATDATVHAHGQENSTSPSISNAMSSNASASKPEPGSTVDQTTVDQSHEVHVPSTGANSHPTTTDPTTTNANPNPEVPFKERVIGVAKKTRGTILNKPEVKEHGERILQGSASVHDATGRSVS